MHACAGFLSGGRGRGGEHSPPPPPLEAGCPPPPLERPTSRILIYSITVDIVHDIVESFNGKSCLK